MKQRALVIGGSLGGLLAANWLHRSGWEVDVFERVENDLASRGAGIGTHDELHIALGRLGLPVDDTISVQVEDRICLDRGGRIVARAGRLGAYLEARLKPPEERTEAEREPPAEVLMREIGSSSVDIAELTGSLA